MIKIAVVGLGYVGFSNALVLSRHHDVVALDLLAHKVEMVNAGHSPLEQADMQAFMDHEDLQLRATLDPADAFNGADYVVIATPTNYDSQTNRFDTSTIETVIRSVIQSGSNAVMVIRSTVPVGYTKQIRERFASDRIMFCPEFLREERALQDSLHPSRIIVGDPSHHGREFAGLMQQAASSENIPTLFMPSTEAEAIKLFANTYLAMRVAFFNELDTYALTHGLDTRQIIDGVCLDPRIGNFYNNPSFGYGGYCLPKDTRQLLANYEAVPQNLIHAIVTSNQTRKDFIASDVLKRKPRVVGIFRLLMKQGADNFRSSAVQSVMQRILATGTSVLVYEPLLDHDKFLGCEVINDLEVFKSRCDLIIANRHASVLEDVADRVYTRDIFGLDA